jgi:hypothetical protein
MRVQAARGGEVSTLISVDGTMRRGRWSAEGVGARSGKGPHSTSKGRLAYMFWKEVDHEAQLALLNIKTDNKTISQIYFTVIYI